MSQTDYAGSWRYKKPRLRKAFAAFEFGPHKLKHAFHQFCKRHAAWLEDYALYCALKERYQGKSWDAWPVPLKDRHPAALDRARNQLGLTMRYHQFLQFVFFRQWAELKKAANKKGILLVGDMPIFVAHDSADVWANRSLFWLDKRGQPTEVAGVPPDYFSRTGQRWGNPLYHWPNLKRTRYSWWIARFKTVFTLVDVCRLDHFIGFHNYWRIPASHTTAQKGRWMPGPGAHFFRTLFQRAGKLKLIAEDLGVVTPEVTALRESFGLPGMKVLQFAFSGDAANPFLPHNFSKNTVVYTGTHDNDTTRGWFRSLNRADRAKVTRYVGTNGRTIEWDLIKLAFSSVADTAIVPMQDLLGLETEARMNMPGTPKGNWAWRLTDAQLASVDVKRLRALTELYGRC